MTVSHPFFVSLTGYYSNIVSRRARIDVMG